MPSSVSSHHERQVPRPPATRPRRSSRVLEYAAITSIFCILAVLAQWKAGAYNAELSGNPDESAHYITGLMIRDYIASGHFSSPMTYAEQYYAHYPKVAFGMWPPFFHFVEALWILLFSPAKASVLLLMALITAVTATTTYYLVRANFGWILALAAGILFVLSPLVQVSTSSVMADGLIALLDLWAMIFLLRYVGNKRTQDAVWFGILTALSMATKANGAALVLLPVLLMLVSSRWELMRRRGLYYAAAIILVFGVPWPMLSYWMIERSVGGAAVTLAVILQTAGVYLRVLWSSIGWGVSLLCIIGVTQFLLALRERRTDLTLSGAVCLLFSVWGYHSLIGNGSDRYMIAALPPVLILAAAGFDWAVRALWPRRVPLVMRRLALGALGVAFFFEPAWAAPRKPYQGFDEPAHFLLTSPEFSGGNFLVISNTRGEGAFITEIAMHDRRPGHLVLRSSKVMASTNWYGNVYHLRYANPEEIRGFLDRAPIDAVALDTRPSQDRPDDAAVELEQRVNAAIKSDPHWQLRGRFPATRNAAPWIDLYCRIGPQPSGPIQLDLHYTLGKDIVAAPEQDKR